MLSSWNHCKPEKWKRKRKPQDSKDVQSLQLNQNQKEGTQTYKKIKSKKFYSIFSQQPTQNSTMQSHFSEPKYAKPERKQCVSKLAYPENRGKRTLFPWENKSLWFGVSRSEALSFVLVFRVSDTSQLWNCTVRSVVHSRHVQTIECITDGSASRHKLTF